MRITYQDAQLGAKHVIKLIEQDAKIKKLRKLLREKRKAERLTKEATQ